MAGIGVWRHYIALFIYWCSYFYALESICDLAIYQLPQLCSKRLYISFFNPSPQSISLVPDQTPYPHSYHRCVISKFFGGYLLCRITIFLHFLKISVHLLQGQFKNKSFLFKSHLSVKLEIKFVSHLLANHTITYGSYTACGPS